MFLMGGFLDVLKHPTTNRVAEDGQKSWEYGDAYVPNCYYGYVYISAFKSLT